MEKYDVVVIGGGASGLSSAYKLMKENRNLRVCVLEARDRVGGRTETVRKGNIWCDVGGQWFGKQQVHAVGLIKELNLELFNQYEQGNSIFQSPEKIVHYDPNVREKDPLYPVDILTDKAQIMADNLSESGLNKGEWTEQERKYDEISFSNWLDDNKNEKGVGGKLGALMTGGLFSTLIPSEPEEYSLLFFLHFLRSCEGYHELVDVKNGVQEWRIKGGAQLLSIRMAEEIAKMGGKVYLNSEVLSVENQGGVVKILTKGGRKIEGRYCVCTAPLHLQQRINFTPNLPKERTQLAMRSPMGSIIKCIFFYKTPFWRKKNLSANTFSLVPPISIAFDASTENDECPALVAFIAGKNARKWGSVSQEQRKSDVLKQLSHLFGKEVYDHVDYIEKNWAEDPYSGGCYFSVPFLNTHSNFSCTLKKPFGNIHFAGTETANSWMGFIDGAIESGYRVAKEIAVRIQNQPKI